MPDKYAKFAEFLSQGWPGLLMMTSAVQPNPVFKQIVLAMVIVAIPSGVVSYTSVQVMKSELHQIEKDQMAVKRQMEIDRREHRDLFKMQYRQGAELSAIRAKLNGP